MNRPLLLMLAAAAFVALPGGCGDECRTSSGKCEGNTAWVCTAGEHQAAHWVRLEDCGTRVCRSAESGAVCSLSPERDPACAGSAGNAMTCAGSIRILCGLGYRLSEVEDCLGPALCDPTGCARVGAPHPLCAMLAEPTASVRTTCYQNQVLLCREGALRGVTDCGARQCTRTAPPMPGAEWCDDGKCVPYFPEPLAECR
jgi:hypothetical protein